MTDLQTQFAVFDFAANQQTSELAGALWRKPLEFDFDIPIAC